MSAPHYTDDAVTLYAGDCLDVLPTLPDNSVDAVVTDPPYGLEFMGKEWDKFKTGRGSKYASAGGMSTGGFAEGNGYANRETPSYVSRPAKRCAICGKQAWSGSPCKCEAPEWVMDNSPLHSFQQWCQLWAAECLRVLKPGGHLLAFGGTRTWHRLAVAIEDAGFEIRDTIAWLYGSGFPKSLDVSKAIDKAAGAEREVVGQRDRYLDGRIRQNLGDRNEVYGRGLTANGVADITAPATADAQRWQGWGTALKPAHEPIVVARKPLAGTVAANVLAHGTGALNIDGCRVAGAVPVVPQSRFGGSNNNIRTAGRSGEPSEANPAGRWPANVALDETAAAALDRMSGEAGGGFGIRGARAEGEGWAGHRGDRDRNSFAGTGETVGYGDTGGASRFFFVASNDDVTDCKGGMIEPCGTANTAAQNSSQQRNPGGSAPCDAATSDSPEGSSKNPWRAAPSTSATATESRPSGSSDTPKTRPIGNESSPGPQHAEPSPSGNPASAADRSRPIDTTTTTPSLSKSSGSADPATSPTTSRPREAGAQALPVDSLGSRFTYTAKAGSDERITHDGVAHPTVKPLSLMRWLVRLVTPPGGLILDPFAGSGTTVEAAILEGFRCIAIEREADYLPLITQRINRRLDPITYLTAAGEDLGIFDFEEPA